MVTAFERIADSVARLAGLPRPRLESWHEQDVYEPRYKDVSVDGGAPGPKASTRIADVMTAGGAEHDAGQEDETRIGSRRSLREVAYPECIDEERR